MGKKNKILIHTRDKQFIVPEHIILRQIKPKFFKVEKQEIITVPAAGDRKQQ